MSESIVAGSRIRLNFAVHLEQGECIDGTFDREPVEVILGDGKFLPGFEQALIGLRAGDHQRIPLVPESAFGAWNPQNVQELPLDSFVDMTLDKGILILFKDAGGGELPGVIKDFNDKSVVVDFNHPLAGRPLIFEVQILQVYPA